MITEKCLNADIRAEIISVVRPAVMVHILDGTSAYDAHVCCRLGNLICLKRLLTRTARSNFISVTFFLSTWAACSERPPYVSSKPATSILWRKLMAAGEN